MEKFPNIKGIMLEHGDKLPDLSGAKYLYLDCETTSGDNRKMSVNPWHNCGILGIGITTDQTDTAYYLPIKHFLGARCFKLADIIPWLSEVISTAEMWVNHNVKYDAHVIKNCTGIDPPAVLWDTLTQAKIIDSDRVTRGGYSLKALSKAWCGRDISKFDKIINRYLGKGKDYSKIPGDICGEYCCVDCHTVKLLHKYIVETLHEDCVEVSHNEVQLTRLLYSMEQAGLHIDPEELKSEQFKAESRMSAIEDELTEIVGFSFRPHVSDDCYKVLCGKYGLPVLGYTDNGKPSFDKEAMALYSVHPDAPLKVMELISEYKKLVNALGLFLKPYQVQNKGGVIHCSYNQAIRTGRMSCVEPNMMQCNKVAKGLVHPPPGHHFISTDASQIEFRTIVHYIKDEAIIKAYNDDPFMDFHQWVADQAGIERKPAKTVNFQTAFGGGVRKLVTTLAQNKHLVGTLKPIAKEIAITRQVPDDLGFKFDPTQQQWANYLAHERGKLDPKKEKFYNNTLTVEIHPNTSATWQRSFVINQGEAAIFKHLAERKALHVHQTYHAKLPTLKPRSKQAELAAKAKGYVRNLQGRHRHIEPGREHIAFNTVNQATAADIVKERMVALDKWLEFTPVQIVAQVHDEILLTCPSPFLMNTPTLLPNIVKILAESPAPLSVPLRWCIGASAVSWADAAGQDMKIDFDSCLTPNESEILL